MSEKKNFDDPIDEYVAKLQMQYAEAQKRVGGKSEQDLIKAVRDGNVELVARFIKCVTNIDALNRAVLGVTALIMGVILGRVDMVNLLLEYGADAEATDSSGDTPLIAAVHKGNIEIVNILINKGAAVNAISGTAVISPGQEKTNALKEAIMMYVRKRTKNYHDIIELLIVNGTRLDTDTFRNGKTPLILSTGQTHLKIIKPLLYYRLGKSLKISFNPIRRVVFDIETKPFSEAFRNADNDRERRKLAPKMRVACAYDEYNDRYTYYTEENASKLIALLENSDEVISFNGLGFDVLVLQKYYGLKGKVPIKGLHIDLYQEFKVHGWGISLDKAARLNLNEKKHTAGREMEKLDLKELKVACRSDVEQTYKLYKLYEKGDLIYE